jgi:hypothetical protein
MGFTVSEVITPMDQYKMRLEKLQEDAEIEIRRTEQAIDIVKNDPEEKEICLEWADYIEQKELELELIALLKECNSQEEVMHVKEIFDAIIKNGGPI